MPVEHDAQKIRIKLFQDVISAVVREVDTPILEDRASRPVLCRIVGSRNPLLQKLTQNLRSVEGWIAGIGASDHRTRGRVVNAIPDRTFPLSKVAWIIVQHVRQETKNKKGRGNLIRLSRSKSLCIGAPALPIV